MVGVAGETLAVALGRGRATTIWEDVGNKGRYILV
jgi:hypothetical protein